MRTHRLRPPRVSYADAKALIGERIKEARENCGLSQSDLAKVLYCNQATVSRIERGVVSPDVAQIRVLSGLFELSVLWLMGYPSFVVHAGHERR